MTEYWQEKQWLRGVGYDLGCAITTAWDREDRPKVLSLHDFRDLIGRGYDRLLPRNVDLYAVTRTPDFMQAVSNVTGYIPGFLPPHPDDVNDYLSETK